MEEIIEQIVRLEWDFFQRVRAEGGRAACQDDWETFSIMRQVQMYAFSFEVCKSYLDDLSTAAAAGRNPVQLKYAYMMAFTDSGEYSRIRPFLPVVSKRKKDMTDAIMEYMLGWAKEYASAYPCLSGGRPILAQGDSVRQTSLETYLCGELWTYSETTLALLLAYAEDLLRRGKNLALMIVENTVHAYGYASILQAEYTCRQNMLSKGKAFVK